VIQAQVSRALFASELAANDGPKEKASDSSPEIDAHIDRNGIPRAIQLDWGAEGTQDNKVDNL
jgi:hypothetical protein